MTLRRRVQALVGALVVLLLVAVALDITVARERDRTADRIEDRLRPARDDLSTLLVSIVDQETGQRGYLLTGDDDFLEPYVVGRRQSEEALDSLRQTLGGDDDLLAAIDRIRSRLEAWQQLAADFEIEARRSGREDVVSALVASGTGKRLFDDAREEIDAARAAVQEDLDDQRGRLADLDDRVTNVRLGTLVLIGAVLVLTARLLSRWVTVPLHALGEAVRKAASGALDDPIPAAGPPDLADLATDIEAMRRRLLDEVDDAARARAALADRGMIVVALRDDLAPTPVALPAGLRWTGRFRPAKGLVAGDWYDVVRLDADRAAMVLVDVSGHGAEVATFALRTKALTMAAVEFMEPGAVFHWLADRLGDTDELFLTGVIAVVDAPSGRVRYASAGHPPVLLGGVTGVHQLAATGPIVGPFPSSWRTEEAQLDRGGVLVAYSDGLTEARDGTGALFGVERLAAVVAETQLDGVDAVADACLGAAERFADGVGQDDLTLFVVSR